MVRWYKKELVSASLQNVHMSGVTISVHKERFVSNQGDDNIPHKIALAVATSIDWLNHAIAQITVSNYLDANCPLAKIYLHVYRDAVVIPPRNPLLSEQEQIKQKNKTENAVKDELVEVREKMTKIRLGLSKNQIIKVNDGSIVTDEGEVKHYLGRVKPASKTEYGNITVGFRAFRERQNLARIIIHEAAHKYAKSSDGRKSGGYWNKQFSDYLDPSAMVPQDCKNNADSYALFVWAMNVGRDNVPDISNEFSTSMENRWRTHILNN